MRETHHSPGGCDLPPAGTVPRGKGPPSGLPTDGGEPPRRPESVPEVELILNVNMDIPANPSRFYLLMLHRPTGQRYAFRLSPPFHVTGCLGPRDLLQWRETDLTRLAYDENLDLVPWANERMEEFDPTF